MDPRTKALIEAPIVPTLIRLAVPNIVTTVVQASTGLIETYGTLHEAQLLPRSFGEGSLVRGQTKPAAVKQLLANMPTAVRGLKSRKVSPVKALWHHKLPDQNEIKRIYTEIETKDERLELNLYIVGEGGGEEEGATAEGSQES